VCSSDLAPFVRSDFDKGPFPIVSFTSIKQKGTQKTVELQLLSNSGTPLSESLEWVGGLYYIEADGGFDPLGFTVAPNFLSTLPVPVGDQLANLLNGLLTPLGLPPVADGVTLNSHGVSVAESISVYLQGTYKILEQFDLTLGARYQEETRDLRNGALAVATGEDGEIFLRRDPVPKLHAYQLSPKVALQYRPTDLSQVYLSWARAYKSPTYNTVNFFNTPEAVDEEKVDSYELGFKSDLLDASLRLNGAVFFIQQKDLLTGFVALASGGIVTYANAGDAETKGAEADFVWTPFPEANPGLALTGAFTYLHSEYTDYKDGRGFDEATGLAFGEGSLTALPARDFTGNRVVRTPKWTYSFGINQRFPVGPGDIEIGADTYYNDGFFFLPQNSDFYARESYQLYNARISYFYNPWAVQFTVFGENITDEEYSEVISVDDFGRNQVLNNPRVVGVRLNWTF
jgi:iron complex outermembrane receptor protein